MTYDYYNAYCKNTRSWSFCDTSDDTFRTNYKSKGNEQVLEEFRVYENLCNLYNNSPNFFNEWQFDELVPPHRMVTVALYRQDNRLCIAPPGEPRPASYKNIMALERELSMWSFFDLYDACRDGDISRLYGAFMLTKSEQPCERSFKKPTHDCCLQCRICLATLASHCFRMIDKIRHFVSFALQYYSFVITPDNIDVLYCVIDFDDYELRDKPISVNSAMVTKTMLPFYTYFFKLYQHLGCYLLSSPIYDEPVENLTTDKFVEAIRKSNGIHRPTKQAVFEFLHIQEILGVTEDILTYDFTPEYTLTTECIEQLYPTHYNYQFLESALESPEYQLWIMVKFWDLNEATISKLNQLNQEHEVHLLVPDHPYKESLEHHRRIRLLQVWFNSLYDSNVNLSHFFDLDALGKGFIRYPIFGEYPVKSVVDCDIEKCMKSVPESVKICYVVGSALTALVTLKDIKVKKVNPLRTFDQAILEIGTLDEKIANSPNLDAPINFDYKLIEHLRNNGVIVGIPGQKHPEEKSDFYFTEYFFNHPTEEGVFEDFQLFNMNLAGAIDPVNLLMAYDFVTETLRNRVLKCDGVPMTLPLMENIKISKPNKSAGAPYMNYKLNSQRIRDVYGSYRENLVYHTSHSAEPSLTTILVKSALSKKNRDRTIQAISVNKSEPGRKINRTLLEKFKASSKNGGPVAIGFSPQYGGWDSLLRKHVENSLIPLEHVRRGTKDYPKWDRRVANILQITASHILRNLMDPASIKSTTGLSLKEFEFMSDVETQQVVFDYVVFGDKLYQKPGGVTSGNSRTADGNSACHLVLDAIAIISEATTTRIIDGVSNHKLHREIRNRLMQPSTRTSQDYMDNPLTWEQVEYVRQHIADTMVLSDDGLTLFDQRLVNFDNYMNSSRLVSNYDIAKEKYSVHKIDDYHFEFLSQHTIEINGMLYPLPEFNRLFTSMYADRCSVQDDMITISRLVALYTLLYPHKYANNAKHREIISIVKEYIEENKKHINSAIVSDNLLSFSVEGEEWTDIDRTVERILGLDLAPAIEANFTAPCFLCANPAIIRCLDCDFFFCNDLRQSHFFLHYQHTNHRSFSYGNKNLRCTECAISPDIDELYCVKENGVYKFRCIKHRADGIKALNEDEQCLIFGKTENAVILTTELLNPAIHMMITLTKNEDVSCTKLAFKARKVLPHILHSVVLHQARKEAKNIINQAAVIPFEIHGENPLVLLVSEKFQRHGKYFFTYGSNSVLVVPKFLYRDNETYWTFEKLSAPDALVYNPLDTISEHVNCAKLQLSLPLENLLRGEKQLGLFKTDPYDGNNNFTKSIIENVRISRFSVIHGPPGTGKTSQIVHLITWAISNNKRVLVFTPSHAAADVVANRIFERIKDMCRILTSDEEHPALTPELPIKQSTGNESLAVLTVQSFKAVHNMQYYDLVIFDEFSQLNDFYIMQIIQRIGTHTAIAVFGDPLQLGCVDEVRRKLPIRYTNIFCDMLDGDHVTYLNVNYRSHPDIVKIVSKNFYSGTLISENNPEKWKTGGVRYCEYQLQDCVLHQGSKGKNINYTEGDLLLEILNREEHRGEDFLVITPYSSQVNYLRSLTQNMNNVVVSTVDSSQGSECEIVIFSSVVTNPFTRDARRLNVALSRAVRYLYILQSSNHRLVFDRPAFIESQSYPPYLLEPSLKCNFPFIQLSPIPRDYIAIDTEFLKVRGLKTHAIMSVAAYTPLTQHVFVGADSRIPDEFLNGLNFQTKAQKAPPELLQLWKNTLKQARFKRKIGYEIELSHIVDRASDSVISKPHLIFYSGHNDIAVLSDIFDLPSKRAKCHFCKDNVKAVYLEKGNYVCAYHASSPDKFHRPSFVNITCDQENYVLINGRRITRLPADYHSRKLKDVHDYFCDLAHGDAHDPLADAKMTFCLFRHLAEQNTEKLHFQTQSDFRLRTFDPFRCTTRRKFLEAFHAWNPDIKFCELGGGEKPYPNIYHNIDIKFGQDMNEHECGFSPELYVDSFYYRTKPLTKEAYILSDIAYDAYVEGFDKKFYHIKSKTLKYQTETFPTCPGEPKYEMALPTECSKELTTTRADFEIAPPCYVTQHDNYQICIKHKENIRDIFMINRFAEYGYTFNYFLPKTKVEFNPAKMMIPNYENRKKDPLAVRLKAYQIAEHLNKSYIGFPSNINIVYAGAASFHGNLVMGAIFDQIFSSFNPIQHVDPNIIPGPNCHRTTLRDFKPDSKTYLLISDIYTLEYDFIREIDNYISKYMANDGIAIIKITSRNRYLDSLVNLAAAFEYYEVVRLPITGLSSELFVYLYSYRPENRNIATAGGLMPRLIHYWERISRGELTTPSYVRNKIDFKVLPNLPARHFKIEHE